MSDQKTFEKRETVRHPKVGKAPATDREWSGKRKENGRRGKSESSANSLEPISPLVRVTFKSWPTAESTNMKRASVEFNHFNERSWLEGEFWAVQLDIFPLLKLPLHIHAVALRLVVAVSLVYHPTNIMMRLEFWMELSHANVIVCCEREWSCRRG